ncbi:MAG: MerR family transcriptional regulator [Rhodospirillales bacterium]|nr:MerR family transcriptional regulator [Rhodospirillales bacterium]
MRIGEAATRAGVSVETIRFYESKGLIDQPRKPQGGGFRDYPMATVDRIRFVRQAQEIGFSLREISELLSLQADPKADCADIRARAVQKRDQVQSKINHMRLILDALDDLVASCPGGGEITACTIIDAMNNRALHSGVTRNEAQPEGKDAPDMKTTLLNIEGMHCDGCAHTIELLLTRVPGVRKVDASYAERQARVLHDPDTASKEDLVTAIDKGGFVAAINDQ